MTLYVCGPDWGVVCGPDWGVVCGPDPDDIEVIRTEVEPERWCFGERKRRTGVHVLKGMTTEAVMRTMAYGWAEPYWTYRCDGCGRDCRWGFGAWGA